MAAATHTVNTDFQDDCTVTTDTLSCLSSPCYFVHNPYALPSSASSSSDSDSCHTSEEDHSTDEFGDHHSDHTATQSCDSPTNTPFTRTSEERYGGGSMILLSTPDGTEHILSRAEVIDRMRRLHGAIDREAASPCGHLGRVRRRNKNSVTHCRCWMCGAIWKEIAYSRIRPDQLEEYLRSLNIANS